jgi:hypothetical protein
VELLPGEELALNGRDDGRGARPAYPRVRRIERGANGLSGEPWRSHTALVARPAVPQERAFVGRQAELQVLADLVNGGAGSVGYVHGVAGIGKSVLLSRFLRRARDSGVGVVEIDCQTVEPTERGVLQASGGIRTTWSWWRI